MFQPVIPLSGISGWNFLQSTYDRQLSNFSDSTQIRRDRDDMIEKLSKPITVEQLLEDTTLLRTAMTSFDLAGEEWKRGFVRKVLSEADDTDGSFLTRLNNPQYTRFAEMFKPKDGVITLSPQQLTDIGERFDRASFNLAVGEIDDDMRLGLNYQTEISELVGTNASEDAVLYRILGSVPVRTILEKATNLPTDIRSLPIEQQADMLRERLGDRLGIRNLAELTTPENINKVVERFHVMQSITNGPSASTPGMVALTLLGNIGSNASQNLFLSGFL